MGPRRQSRAWTRRDAIRLGLAGATALLAGCIDIGAEHAEIEVLGADQVPPAEPPPPSLPAFRRGTSTREVLPGTAWATPLSLRHSGAAGPVVLVLGGVHGDEPGAALAAEEIAIWEPKVGSLLVLPRANVLALEAGERTLPELGDLNRLYPGDPRSDRPMARMAAAIVGVAREFRVLTVYDMHESWQFFTEREEDGDASLGQTVSAGVGPESPLAARALVARANLQIEEGRERLVARREIPPRRASTTNSLGLGRFVSGLTTLLVEMGQEEQEVERRAGLHLMVARTFLESRGML